MELAARYKAPFSRSFSRSKILSVWTRISPTTAPAVSSSANEGIFDSAAELAGGGAGFSSGATSCAAAGANAPIANARQPNENARRGLREGVAIQPAVFG